MRIVIVVPAFHASPSEPFIPAWMHLVSELARRHHVHVLPLRRPTTPTYSVFGATVHPGPLGDVRRRVSPALWTEAVARVARIHRQTPFSLIYGLQAHEAGMVAALAGRLLGLPAAVHVHGGELTWRPELDFGGQGDLITRWQTRIALRSAALVTAGSRPALALASRLAPQTTAKWAPYGVDAAFGPSVRRPQDPVAGPRFISVADLNPVKRHRTLLRAFARVRHDHPTATLHLVGDGPERRNVLSEIGRLGLTPSVVLAGRLPHGGLPGLLNRYDVFVQASAFEAQGLALLEALATGLPAASTRVGAAIDLSEGPDPLPGLQVASGWSSEDLAHAMTAAASSVAGRANPPEKARAGAAARQSAAVHRHYGLETAVARLERALSEATRHGASGAVAQASDS